VKWTKHCWHDFLATKAFFSRGVSIKICLSQAGLTSEIGLQRQLRFTATSGYFKSLKAAGFRAISKNIYSTVKFTIFPNILGQGKTLSTTYSIEIT
jgi:hypothetical protein